MSNNDNEPNKFDQADAVDDILSTYEPNSVLSQDDCNFLEELERKEREIRAHRQNVEKRELEIYRQEALQKKADEQISEEAFQLTGEAIIDSSKVATSVLGTKKPKFKIISRKRAQPYEKSHCGI